MPNKLRVLSGKNLIAIFLNFGFEIENQKGSHIKLQRKTTYTAKQILTIPNHQEIDKGTLKAIFRQAIRYIPENELRVYFYI